MYPSPYFSLSGLSISGSGRFSTCTSKMRHPSTIVKSGILTIRQYSVYDYQMPKNSSLRRLLTGIQCCIMPAMKNLARLLLSVFLTVPMFSSASGSSADSSKPLVYVIPIKGEIEAALVYVIRRGVAEAERKKADAVIFEMDTPGGRVDSTEKIIHLITGLKTKTYTLVNPSAISAGAIIAMATDEIYMTPEGRIGDAMPIMMSPIPMSGPQAMPDNEREKVVSYVESLIRSVAQQKGHDVEVASAMVRRENEYKIDDLSVSKAGEILTLTSAEAAQLVGNENKPLLSKGTVKDLDELVSIIAGEDAEVRTLTVTPAEKIARFIESMPVSGAILALALLAVYIEFKTPGFGIPGITGIILFVIWFWGHHMAGLAGTEEILIFAIGVALLLVEIFLIPGFGATGIIGIALIVVALAMAMVQALPGAPWYSPPVWQMEKAMYVLGASISTFGLAAFILAKYLPSVPMFKQLTLQSAISASEGYTSAPQGNELIGKKGFAETDLRPGGTASIEDKKLSVVSRGEFIDKGTRIVVEETHGSRIVVRKEVG